MMRVGSGFDGLPMVALFACFKNCASEVFGKVSRFDFTQRGGLVITQGAKMQPSYFLGSVVVVPLLGRQRGWT